MRWFLCFCVASYLFANSFDDLTPSSPDEIASLNTDLLIDGYVSALSGQLLLSEVDLHIKGAQDLLLQRTYIPPHIFGRYDDKERLDQLALGLAVIQLETKGWVFLPHLRIGYNPHSPHLQVRDPSGFVLEFALQGKRGVLKTCSYGCTNLRLDEPSSVADIRNIELWVEGDQIKIIWPNGMQRFYTKQYKGAIYLLEHEVLPNGKAIFYEFDSKQDLVKIISSDIHKKHIYGSIIKKGNHLYEGSDGTKVHLAYETREIKAKVKKHGRATFFCNVLKKASNASYTHTIDYNARTLLRYYDAQKFPISCNYTQTKGAAMRVRTFSTPSGTSRLAYDPPIAGEKEGFTVVTHPNGSQTIYRFNKILLLEAIENWCKGELINKKTFDYDEKQHVKAIETRDGKDNLLLSKQYTCDEAGNPLLETVEGDFGSFSIRRKFDKNRLVFEERDDGLQYAFTYLGKTWLVTSMTTLESGKQLRKTLYHYDDANNLILEEEQGKTRTHYTLYQTNPHLHRIEWEEKRDWNNALVCKRHYVYDQWGNLVEEKHFGSDGELAYTLRRTYNEKGELLEETNPLGQIATYQYDIRGRCVKERPIANNLVIERTFDTKGRLKTLKENNHKTLFAYNASDQLIEKTDYLGHTIKYDYHPVHGKPVRVEDSDAITKIIYDFFGREKERTDPYGAITKKQYNSYGSLLKITYSNGGEEHFSYAPNGLLQSHIDPDGLKTVYAYDALGRLQEKTIAEQVTLFHYDGYHLLETIDPAGYITKYEYDLVGRKIQEKWDTRTIHYGYDPLGFLSWEEKGNRRIDYTHDVLGRLQRKTIDELLEITWTYDRAGNVAKIEQEGATKFAYDAHNRLIEKIDPNGHVTTIQYDIAPQVLIKKITNPLGIETIETYNFQEQLLKREVAGKVIENLSYDKHYRLNSQDQFTFAYTANGKKKWMQEAEKRKTTWTYTPGDKIQTKQNPDGTLITCEYDRQGRPIKVGNREFQYDALDRIIGGTGFSRKLDPFGNILREEWTNGLWIESDYDDWDRPLERRLFDQSRIVYAYEGPFLKKVTRFNKDGLELYSHTYSQHDAKGNPLIEEGLFLTEYEYDKLSRKISQKNLYLQETHDYDSSGNLIRKGDTTYTYDHLSQMTSESGHFIANYDRYFNLYELNGDLIQVDHLNQIDVLSYDLNGNLLRPGFVYDEYNQLIEFSGEKCIYDALGRRLQKGSTAYFYIGSEEIGSFHKDHKEIKILGDKDPIAIEIDEKLYVPITDIQGTIRYLIDGKTQEISHQNNCDAFGLGLTDEIPYAYFGKRYDPETNLVYFGKRYYDPSHKRWLTPDPLGPVDHSNLYQFVFNNPYRYFDPDGQFVLALPLLIWGAELAIPTLSAMAAPVIYGAITGAVIYGGYKVAQTINNTCQASNWVYQPVGGCPQAWVMVPRDSLKVENRISSDEPGSPPIRGDQLIGDGTDSPGQGFDEWKGNGSSKTGNGSWIRGGKVDGNLETLYPDLDHPEPIGPHWDYNGPNFPKGARIYPDGTWEPK